MGTIHLGKYNFCVHYFFHRRTNIVHSARPFHLAIHFKLFSDTLLLCHLLYKLRKHIVCLLIDTSQVAIQLPAE